MSNSLRPHQLYSPWDALGQNTGYWVAFPFSRGSSQHRNQTEVSLIAGGFFNHLGHKKSKNDGVGNLSLLQGIILTQESNWGLLHCRQILYQLSYQGSPL